jgi:cytochrome c-type biogenesis protein CcmH
MLWLAIALMTLVALALLAVTFVRRGRSLAAPEAYDLAVYRDQLSELEQDLARGTITAAEAAAARLEIQRRMLRRAAAAKANHAAEPTPSPVPARPGLRHWLPLGAAGVVLPAAAIGLYLALGSPDLPGRPFAEVRQAAELEGQSIEAAITALKQRLDAAPQDLDGWLLLGRSYIFLKRYAEAVDVLRRAAVIGGGRAEVNAMLAEAMVFQANGVVGPEARQLFESVREKAPKDPAALYYIGMAEAQGGYPKAALATWEELAAITPGSAPWRDDLVKLMKQAAAEVGVEPRVLPPLPETGATAQATPEAALGPSAEEMQAASEMSPEDRQAMIRAMVERLATRLKENSDDLAGWRRLANAYRVLGEEAKAKEAEAEIARLEAEGGGAAAATPPPAPAAESSAGPSAAEMEAAAALPPEDQRAMITAMVEGLAKRLEGTPDDLEGWKRLARSYRVLGDLAKALPAYEKAASLAPEDAAVQADYARALLDAAPQEGRLPEAAVARYRRVLELNPDHLDALWFVGYAEATAPEPNREAARAHWLRLLGLLTPGSDSYVAVENALKALEQPS